MFPSQLRAALLDKGKAFAGDAGDVIADAKWEMPTGLLHYN